MDYDRMGTGKGSNNTLVEKLGRFFYIVDYRTHRYQHIKDVPDYIVDAAPFFMIAVVIEFIITILNGKHDRINIFYYVTNISAGIYDRLFTIFHRPLTLLAYCYVYKHYCVLDLPWDSFYTWWFAFLVVDFCYYWLHRATHEINIFWASHQVHHSGEDLNLGTALRQSVAQKYITLFFYVPMALIFPPSAFYIHWQFNLVYQFWIHTEIVTTLGPLEYIFNTASHHRVHHGRNPYCIDKNYGGTLIIWDRIFNTFAQEDEPVAYGLVSNEKTASPWKIQFGHFISIFQRSAKMDNWKDKLSVFFRGPGWMAESEKVGLTEDEMKLPEVEQPIIYRDRNHFKMDNFRLEALYAVAHFLVVSFAFQEFFASKTILSSVEVTTAILFFFWTLTSLGCVGRTVSVLDMKSFPENMCYLKTFTSNFMCILCPAFDANVLRKSSFTFKLLNVFSSVMADMKNECFKIYLINVLENILPSYWRLCESLRCFSLIVFDMFMYYNQVTTNGIPFYLSILLRVVTVGSLVLIFVTFNTPAKNECKKDD